MARTVDGADPFATAVRASQMAMVITDPLEADDRTRHDASVSACIAGHGDYDIAYRITIPARDVRWFKIRGQPF